MGNELLDIGVKMRKVVIFAVRGCFRSVCNHPFLVGLVCFLVLLYRSSPYIFSLLVSASPVLVCTAVLLGTLLSFGQPNIPEIEIEEKTTHEAISLKSGVSEDATVVERTESYYVEKYSDEKGDETDQQPSLLAGRLGEEDENSPLIDERSREIGLENVENWEVNLGDLRYEHKTDRNDGDKDNVNDDEHIELGEDDKAETDSFDSKKVNVDSLDSPPRSPWKLIEEREAQKEEEEEEEDDSGSDSGSDRAESSSPDASMAEIMPMLDELHPLLDEEARNGSDVGNSPRSSASGHESDDVSENDDDAADDENEDEGDKEEGTKSAITWTEEDQKNLMDLGSSEIERNLRLENLIRKRVSMSRNGSDVGNSPRSSASGHESDDVSENHNDAADDENEDEGDKEEGTKSVITWTEEDHKNLMDLGSSEIERNLRLENLIMRRRARKSMGIIQERNLIDLESSILPFNIAPIATRRQNPFDDPHDSYDNHSDLPPIPGSAPSILLPRQNPFDIPYDSSEEKPDLVGDGFLDEFAPSQSRDPFFRRYESFNVRPSIFAPSRHDIRMRPYFVPEGTVSVESSSYSPFRRQLSELSDSKVSSVPETESVGSVEDIEDRKLVQEDNQLELEVSPKVNETTEEGPARDLELIPGEVTDEHVSPQESEPVPKIEHVSEHVGHGSESSDEEDSLELGQVENRDVKDVELEFQQENMDQADERIYSRDSSSSSLSEVSERVLPETEFEEVLPVVEERRDDIAENPVISTQTSVESTDLSNTSTLVNEIPHSEPVYDSSPRQVSRNSSFLFMSSDVNVESDVASPAVLEKRTLSFVERESEGSSSNIQMLRESSVLDPVNEPDSRQIDFADVIELENVNTEAPVEETLVQKQSHNQVPNSRGDENIQTLGKLSEDENLDQSRDNNLVLSGSDTLVEVILPPIESQLTEEHPVDNKETFQSPNSDADELNTTVESDKDVTTIQNLDVPDIEHHDRDIFSDLNHPLSPEFISISETTTSHVDVIPVVQETDGIKDFDEGLLTELDSIGDFSITHRESGSNEFKKHIDSIEGLSSGHHTEKPITGPGVNSAEANKIENPMLNEARYASVKETVFDENEAHPISSVVSQSHEKASSGMPELEASTLEEIHSAFKQLSDTENEKPVILEPPQAEPIFEETVKSLSVTGLTEETSNLEFRPVEDATSDNSVDRAVQVVEPRETQVPASQTHVAELVLSDSTNLPREQVVDVLEEIKLEKEINVFVESVTRGTASELHDTEPVSEESMNLLPQQMVEPVLSESTNLVPKQVVDVSEEIKLEKETSAVLEPVTQGTASELNVKLSIPSTISPPQEMVEPVLSESTKSPLEQVVDVPQEIKLEKEVNAIVQPSTQGTVSEVHVSGAIPEEIMKLPPQEMVDSSTEEQVKPNSDDVLEGVKKDKVETPKDVHSTSSGKGKGKGKASESSSSSSSSSSESSSSDSDQE